MSICASKRSANFVPNNRCTHMRPTQRTTTALRTSLRNVTPSHFQNERNDQASPFARTADAQPRMTSGATVSFLALSILQLDATLFGMAPSSYQIHIDALVLYKPRPYFKISVAVLLAVWVQAACSDDESGNGAKKLIAVEPRTAKKGQCWLLLKERAGGSAHTSNTNGEPLKVCVLY